MGDTPYISLPLLLDGTQQEILCGLYRPFRIVWLKKADYSAYSKEKGVPSIFFERQGLQIPNNILDL